MKTGKRTKREIVCPTFFDVSHPTRERDTSGDPDSLETVISGISRSAALQTRRFSQRTYESTQLKNVEANAGPSMRRVKGIEPSTNESNAQDNIITALYALVASELSIPAYPTGCCWTTARFPCWRTNARRAMTLHHADYARTSHMSAC